MNYETGKVYRSLDHFDKVDGIADIKKDMESNDVMDRLLCGDVGFGKTEVAFRAAFKAISSGRRWNILVWLRTKG